MVNCTILFLSSPHGLVASHGNSRLALLSHGMSRRSACTARTSSIHPSIEFQHLGRKQHFVGGCVAATGSTVQTESNASALVDSLLSLVEGTDRGTLLGEQDRRKVEEIISSLEQQCMPEPLQSPLLFGEWDVVYSSNPTATGGYYRSALGRALLSTKQMMQTVREPDFVSNKVSFAALGILDGEVSLKGKLEALDNRWIKIAFESPDLKLGPIEFCYGGTSSVKIAIIYLDERVRLGRGSRGSLFVFERR